MSVGSRIKELRDHKNISRNELAKKLNVTPGAISNYENGVSSPKEPILFKIMDVLECDANYLYQDDMDIKPSVFTTTLAEQGFLTKYRELDHKSQGAVNILLEYEYQQFKNLNNEKRIKLKTGTLVDFHEIQESKPKLRAVKTTLQSLSAGTGSIGDDDQFTEINYPDEKVPDGTELASKINGDSMEPTYFDGDIVFYELTCHLNEGDIGVFRKNGENFIKEYSRKGLISHNPAYKMIVPGMDDHIETIGKVLGKL